MHFAETRRINRARVQDAWRRLHIDGQPPSALEVSRRIGLAVSSVYGHANALGIEFRTPDAKRPAVKAEIDARIAAVRAAKIATASLCGLDDATLSRILPD